MSLTLEAGNCGCDGTTLSLDLTMPSPCCTPVPAAIVINNTPQKDLIRITSADFVSATEWTGTNTEGIVIRTANVFKVFDNNVNRYLDEGTEWNYAPGGLGVKFLIGGFDSTINNYTFYIHIN